jgi:hypothetical protein
VEGGEIRMKNIFKIVTVFAVLLTGFGLVNAQVFAKTMGMGPGAHLTGASVTAVSGKTLTVSKNSKSYTVDTTTGTKILIKGVTGSVSQISVGDYVNIAGAWTDSTDTIINATLIRDGYAHWANRGAMRRKNGGAFSGSVLSLNNTGFVLQLGKKGQATVVIPSTATIVNKENVTIAQSSIVVGNMLKVDGSWNKTSKVVTATSIQDLSF